VPDQIDELVARSQDCPELRKFHAFHKKHPEILDFIVEEIFLRIDRGSSEFSFNSLWNYARWQVECERGQGGATFSMNDHYVPFYGRGIVILHSEFNGLAEFRPSVADQAFGIEIAPQKRPEDYARRLRWSDGKVIEDGWRPSTPHVITHTANRKPSVHSGADKS
jgi:hypothetical protein